MLRRTNLCSRVVVVLAVLWVGFTTSVFANQCSLQNGQCTYNINLISDGKCESSPEGKIEEEAPEAIRLKEDGLEMHKMQKDFDIVKSDHENRIKELENSIQKVLRNAISSGPAQYTARRVYLEPGEGSPEGGSVARAQGPSENILMLQLQNQFNRMRSTLSKKSADLVDAKNKLNETSDLLKETQRQFYEVSTKLGGLETKSAVLERESNILKNKLKIKTEKLDYTTTKLNHSESKLISIENQLYDVVRSENTLREELETLRVKFNKQLRELEELKVNHTNLQKKHHKTKKTLQLREEELMECYLGASVRMIPVINNAPNENILLAKTQTFCDFEDTNLCGFYQESENDTFDWERQQGRTPSANTGPEYDHTCRDRNGHYMYIESSGKSRDQNALLYSPKYRGLSAQCVQFYYHMYGRHTGTLTLHTKALTSDELTSIWRVFGNQGNLWIKASVSIPEDTAREGYQLVFEGSTSIGYEGDISIDDFSIEDGLCANDQGKDVFGITLPPPLTKEERRKLLQKQIDRYRKLLRRRQRMRNRNKRHAVLDTK